MPNFASAFKQIKTEYTSKNVTYLLYAGGLSLFAYFIWRHRVELLSPIAAPLFDTYYFYDAIVFMWLFLSLFGFIRSSKIVVIAVTSIDVFLISNIYFGLMMSAFFLKWNYIFLYMYIIPIFGLIFLMLVRGESVKHIFYKNTFVILSCLPLVLQYSIIQEASAQQLIE